MQNFRQRVWYYLQRKVHVYKLHCEQIPSLLSPIAPISEMYQILFQEEKGGGDEEEKINVVKAPQYYML